MIDQTMCHRDESGTLRTPDGAYLMTSDPVEYRYQKKSLTPNTKNSVPKLKCREAIRSLDKSNCKDAE